MDNNQKNLFRKKYPNMRYFLKGIRNSYTFYKNVSTCVFKRNKTSQTIPDNYQVCNTSTINSDINLNILEGNYPNDIKGNMYICQCLGSPKAFMVGDTNIVKLSFDEDGISLKNRLMWNPVTIAKVALRKTIHKFDDMGLMYMSPGLGIASYTEGMYLLPDGRLGITSDVDRPWIIDREELRTRGALGKREEWLPMISGDSGHVMGSLFAGYNNSHVIYTDTNTNETFLVNYQSAASDLAHPCVLMKWDGKNDLEKWTVVDEKGQDISIMQSIHELIYTRDYIILADTAFAVGDEMLKPWKSAPLPNTKTVIYIIDRRHLTAENKTVVAKKTEVDEACIHLIAEYENPDDLITIYMLHTPATNTAEIIKSYDVDMYWDRFPKNMIGYGTLPVLDLSSIGRHTIDMSEVSVKKSEYIRDQRLCWGPYMYTYMGRQTREFQEQDLYVMFKGFKPDMLPKRIYNAYKDVENRKVSLDDLVDSRKISVNNSIAKVDKKIFKISDYYVMPDKVLIYTISCIEAKNSKGYLLVAVLRDVADNMSTSGHEYWLFDADRLYKGPICKLGHKSLNNSVLFHTLYLTEEQEKELESKKPEYKYSVREDYKSEELEKWDPSVKETFEKIIWPYLDVEDTDEKTKATELLDFLSTKRVQMDVGKEHLIGEERILDAPKFAELMFEEANRMFKTNGWKKEYEKNGLKVESKGISGQFEKAKVRVARAFCELDVNADSLFKYITSPKGYAVIDPVCDPEDHEKKPLEVYNWKENCRLEAAVASNKMPVLGESDFVVLNAIDSDIRTFASKSIYHKAMPGGSKYSNLSKPANGHERALNTFVLKIDPIGDNRCKVSAINYVDMAGLSTSAINNYVNTKAFFPPLFKRMKKAVKDNSL